MTDEEKRAFKAWGYGVFMGGQQYEGFSNMTKSEREYTKIFDKILDQSVMREGVTVVRKSDAQLVLGKGRRTATLSELKEAEGSIITSKGNMSCGAASEGLNIGQKGKNVEYRISIPKGSKRPGMWIGDDRLLGWGAMQREFMMNRDVSYKVGKVSHDASRDIYVVNLKYIGAQAHDYS